MAMARRQPVSRRAAARSAAALLAAAAALAAVGGGLGAPGAFAGAPRSPSMATSSARAGRLVAQAMAPPDEVLEADGKIESGTYLDEAPLVLGSEEWVNQSLMAEAQRLLPYIDPLLDRQSSLEEVTFALNRQGMKLRPLLFRPPPGLPVFEPLQVKEILKRAGKYDKKGRRYSYIREAEYPPGAAGAPYRRIRDMYAQVPPLNWGGDSSKPWDPADYGMEKEDPFKEGAGFRQLSC